VDAGFDHNKTELGVLVLAGTFQVLAHVHCLLDKEVKVFWDGRCEAVLLEETENLRASHAAHLSDATGVTEDNTNLKARKGSAGRRR
jgi:hypothetical protein